MITGGHTVIYSTDPYADRAFLRDVLKLRACFESPTPILQDVVPAA